MHPKRDYGGMGIPRKVDALGRVVIPVELRRAMEIEVGDLVSVDQDGTRLVIHKVETSCAFCGSRADLTSYRDRMVCAACLGDLRDLGGDA